MSLLDRRSPLRRRDRGAWASTRTLIDLAELTADWVEGTIASTPAYYGRSDLKSRHAPQLVAAVAAVNRGGLLTECSQPALDYETGDYQLAAVTGFTTGDMAAYLLAHLAARYEVVVTSTAGTGPGIGVSFDSDGRPTCVFGRPVPADEIAQDLYPGCGQEAIAEVCAAVQISLVDPKRGRNRLWDDLLDLFED